MESRRKGLFTRFSLPDTREADSTAAASLMKKEREAAHLLFWGFGSCRAFVANGRCSCHQRHRGAAVTLLLESCSTSSAIGFILWERMSRISSTHTCTPFSASAFDPLLIHFFDFVPSSCQIRVAVANTLLCHSLSCSVLSDGASAVVVSLFRSSFPFPAALPAAFPFDSGSFLCQRFHGRRRHAVSCNKRRSLT